MKDSQAGWWFSADRKWHEGEPPRGWWQARSGRWHPPAERSPERSAAEAAEATGATEDGFTTGELPRHLASASPDELSTEEHEVWDTGGSVWPDQRPGWVKLGVPVTLTALMVIVAAIGFLAWGPSALVEDQTTERSGITKSKADFEPPVTTTEDEDGTSTTSGSSDDCQDWTSQGRPDHSVAPDRANRDDCE